MAFSFKGRWAILAIVTIVLVITATLLVNNPSLKLFKLNPANESVQTSAGNNDSVGTGENNGTAGTNETRFVDGITKISTQRNRELIQQSLDITSFAPILIQLDEKISAESFLSTLSPEEFQIIDIDYVRPVVIIGNATTSAISKAQNNPNVTKIYFAASGGGSALQDSVPLINASPAWNILKDTINLTGHNVTVCIIDTGVNYTHPDLGGCQRTNNINTANCSRVLGGYDYFSNDSDPMDERGHGTHVAGIIGARGGIKGVAPDVKFVVLRAWNDSGSLPLAEMRNAIQWCIDNRSAFNPPIKIISISGKASLLLYNTTCNGEDIVVDAANDALAHGLLLVAAAGNDGNSTAMNSPACGSNVTSAGVSTKNDSVSTEFNRNNFTTLMAPGKEINSTAIPFLGNCTYTSPYPYMVCDGTSQATPHISGAAALLFQLNPDLTPNQVVDVLNMTGKNITNPSVTVTFKRIDVLKAIMAVNASLLQVPSISEIYSNDTRKIYEFKILNANLSNITNISWQAIVENGTTINSTINASLLYKQSVMVLFEQNFSKRDIADVNFSARADNLFYSQNYTAQAGDLYISQFNDLATINGTQKIYEFRIASNKTSNVTGINWSYDYGDNGNVSANQLTELQPGKEIFVIVQRNYAGLANRILNATAFTTSRFAEKLKYLTYLNISGLSVLNSSNRYRIFGFNITNLYFKNLTGVFWNVTFGDGGERNVTQPLTVGLNETAFALFDYNYTAAGNYTINVNATNASIIDKKSINISVI